LVHREHQEKERGAAGSALHRSRVKIKKTNRPAVSGKVSVRGLEDKNQIERRYLIPVFQPREKRGDHVSSGKRMENANAEGGKEKKES